MILAYRRTVNAFQCVRPCLLWTKALLLLLPSVSASMHAPQQHSLLTFPQQVSRIRNAASETDRHATPIRELARGRTAIARSVLPRVVPSANGGHSLTPLASGRPCARFQGTRFREVGRYQLPSVYCGLKAQEVGNTYEFSQPDVFAVVHRRPSLEASRCYQRANLLQTSRPSVLE